MPKGTKIVDWTPENEAKLFHTIIAVHDIKVDNAKVAEAFGKSSSSNPSLCSTFHLRSFSNYIAYRSSLG